jgi:transposase
MEETLKRLKKLIAGRNTAQKVVLRAKIVLEYLTGSKKSEIARKLNTSRPTIDTWIDRYQTEGVESLLHDKTRPGRKKTIQEDLEKQIVDATMHSAPKGETNWSTRTMAAHMSVSHMAVQRIWKKFDLKPHLIRTFKVSKDPKFVEKIRDIVGLYLNPPENAIVFCVDEKSQIQALDRTQPGLPMKPGRKGTMTHDYKRHGTTTLFAALDIAKGHVIGTCKKKHRAVEFLTFLKRIDRQTPKGLDLHLVLDNYGTHKTPEIKEWLSAHPRFHFHFTPTGASWVNMVERWFSTITNKMIRRGVFHSVGELIQAIYTFIDHHNENPRVFTWTKDADTIIAKVKICKEALVTEH